MLVYGMTPFLMMLIMAGRLMARLSYSYMYLTRCGLAVVFVNLWLSRSQEPLTVARGHIHPAC
jgi:hypothetical protein